MKTTLLILVSLLLCASSASSAERTGWYMVNLNLDVCMPAPLTGPSYISSGACKIMQGYEQQLENNVYFMTCTANGITKGMIVTDAMKSCKEVLQVWKQRKK